MELWPTTQTSLGPVPHTPCKSTAAPLHAVAVAHAVPFQCRIVPALPTAQASLGPLPHTPYKSLPCGTGVDQHQPLLLHAPAGRSRGPASADASDPASPPLASLVASVAPIDPSSSASGRAVTSVPASSPPAVPVVSPLLPHAATIHIPRASKKIACMRRI